MFSALLKDRVPSAEKYTVAALKGHVLKFHKISKDGSGKCDAFETKSPEDIVYGVLFEISENEKQDLDSKEGLGDGYENGYAHGREDEENEHLKHQDVPSHAQMMFVYDEVKKSPMVPPLPPVV